MTPTQPKLIEYLRTISTDYVDQRVVTEQELRALVWFLNYGQNVFSQVGRDWRGCTFRQSESTCLLVVKSALGPIPQVAFVTGRTPIDCVVIFCKKWHGDTVSWVPDQYG